MRCRYTPATVSAPSSSISIPLRMEPRAGLGWHQVLIRSFAVLAIGFTIAGCAAPGASRLERAPSGMPPSLKHLTADVLGFTLYDARLQQGDDDLDAAQQLAARRGAAVLAVLGTAPDRRAWIGDHAGIAIRQLPSPDERGDVPDARLVFADVRSRARLEEWLKSGGWERSSDDLPAVNGDEGALWTTAGDTARCVDDFPAGDEDRERATCDAGGAAAVFDDAVYVSDSREGLEQFLKAADAYAVPERKAMREYAAEAAKKSPMAAVFRFDLIRTQVRRPFQDDPATLELARWFTNSAVLIAFRDGWAGVTGGGAKQSQAVRVIGNVEWVPDLAPDIDWGTAQASLLDDVASPATVAVSLDGIGQHLTELVTGITRRNGQYATDQDVPADDDPVDLQPVLDQLDGQAAVGWGDGQFEVYSRGDGAALLDVHEAACKAGAPVEVTASSDLMIHGPASPSCGSRSAKVVLRRKAVPATSDLSRDASIKLAGKPPRAPIMWIWSRSIAGCTGPAAGWVTFDGTGEMTFAAHVSLDGGTGECDPALLLPDA